MNNLLLSSFFLLCVGSLFTGCGLLEDENEAILKNADAIQAMEIANEWKWIQKDIKSYVTAREVVFEFPNGKSKKIPLPGDKMLVAVAPYINRTHEWTIHYMSSCQGELPKREFYVKAADKDGTVLVSKNITTLRNGFFELWLPRDRRVELTIQGMGKARGTIETFDTSKTCITTFRMR